MAQTDITYITRLKRRLLLRQLDHSCAYMVRVIIP